MKSYLFLTYNQILNTDKVTSKSLWLQAKPINPNILNTSFPILPTLKLKNLRNSNFLD